ncbi:MAG: ATP-binding protein [Chloroflexi bacterium]|nr:ATP-binding protein [Chloroflexota bacterium]
MIFYNEPLTMQELSDLVKMKTTTVILITGHPATGKTTLAHYLAQELHLPLIWKDQIKESLLESLGWSTTEWSRKLSAATWALLYQQVENLLQANVSHIVESNFDPTYANNHWQKLNQKYDFQLIQVRCETEPETLLTRCCQRIKNGKRHPGHVDVSNDNTFLESIKQHMRWVEIESKRISFNTTEIEESSYFKVAENIGYSMVPSGNSTNIDRLAQECAKLTSEYEQSLAEEGLVAK